MSALRRRLRPALRYAKYRLDAALLANPPSRRRFRHQRPRLDPVQQGIVDALRRDGIARVKVDQLPSLEAPWRAVEEAGRGFARSDTVAAGIERYRQAADTDAGKSYLVRLLPETAALDAAHPLLRFGLAPAILDTVNSYLGLWARLIYTDLWYTVPDRRRRDAVASQRWHRDPEDARLVKVFLYCADVEAEAGPFEYVRGSAGGGRYRRLWLRPRTKLLSSSYPPDGAVEAAVATEDRLVCTGPAGSLIFCDTHGLHRGGLARTDPRILAYWVFVPPASVFDRRYAVDAAGAASLSPPARHAVDG